jgi:hypothetical protein
MDVDVDVDVDVGTLDKPFLMCRAGYKLIPNNVASAFGRWGLGPGVREIYGGLLESWPNRF